MSRRVLLMISSLRRGGSEQQTLLLLRHLDRAEFQPHLFLLDPDGEWMSQVPTDVTVHLYDPQLVKARNYFPGRILRDQTHQLAHILQVASIEVVYDRTFHMSMIAGPACSGLGIPRVSTIVSPPDQALPQIESRFVRLKRQRLAKAYAQSRQVVAVSQAVAESAKRYYRLPEAKLTVIHNGVDIEAQCESARQLETSPSDLLTCVCVGRMTSEKGHRELLEALSVYPDRAPAVRLWMIGDGPQRGELEELATKLPNRHLVEFMGAISNPAPYIKSADALVLPSRFEGMPNVVLEAMALGTPVIATRAGGTVELEREAPTILWCEPANSNSLAKGIEAFAIDREAAELRAANATRLVKEHHAAPVVAAKIARLLRGDNRD